MKENKEKLLGSSGKVNELLPTRGRLHLQVADKARQVRKIIFITQLPGPPFIESRSEIRTMRRKMGLEQQQTTAGKVHGG